MQTTYLPRKSDIVSRWVVLDATDQVLGRLCTRVAMTLMGKDKPMFTPFMDTGDHVVVINAAKVKLTGRKLEQKTYIRHTGYPGGLKRVGVSEVKDKHPERVILEGVKGMLPKTKLGKQMLTKLRVYKGAEHRHQAQLAAAPADKKVEPGRGNPR